MDGIEVHPALENANPVCGTRAIFVKEINNPSEKREGAGGRPTGQTDGRRQKRRSAWKKILAGKSRRTPN